jgi:DNA-binding response OmpR family regulator
MEVLQQEQQISILIAEDEKKLTRSIKRQLENNGYIVEVAWDGSQAQEILQNKKISLLLLDLSLPRKSGIEILEWLQTTVNRIPVIVISAASKLDDRIKGLQKGADDYLVKPFDSSELLARITALLRRTGYSRHFNLKAADLEMDVSGRVVTRAGKRIELSPREFSLLEFLLRNKNQIVTRKRLIEHVWGYNFEVETNIVDVYISYLRNAIDKGFSRKIIHTIHGEGFILSESA